MAGMDIRPSVQRKLLLASYFTGPIAILLVLLLGFFMVSTRPPTPVETYTALTQYNRAEYFARQYLLIWLAGSDRLSDQLSEMTSVGERKIELNPDPLKVTDINVVSVKRWITDVEDETEWSFTLAATTLPPGGQRSRNYYEVTFVEKDGAFQAITLPRLTTVSTTPVTVATKYGQKVALDGTLGKTLSGFVQAYLAPGKNSLSGYVSEEFKYPPVSGAPYSSVKVTSIEATGGAQVGGKEVSAAQPGDSFDILVTVRASVSATTWVTMQLPLRVHMTSNSQWLVDDITSPVDFGEVTEKK